VSVVTAPWWVTRSGGSAAGAEAVVCVKESSRQGAAR
jgi:hypothetical protein